MPDLMKPIDYNTAKEFLLPRHYSGRIPSISYAFGWYDENNNLVAVITYGKPASPSLCVGVCGETYKNDVYELNRLCRVNEWNQPLSKFVAYSLRELKKENIIIISYSDTGMNHNGYIYQACNFIYTGLTQGRTDKYTEGNKHSRHYNNENQHLRKIRTPKHRYIYFCGDKGMKKLWLRALKYPIIKEYPKGENSNYTLGEYQKTQVINTQTNEIYEI
jgi:hypothetical protein